MRAWSLLSLAFALGGAGLACEGRPAGGSGSCPPCECVCENGDADAAAASRRDHDPVAQMRELGDLIAAASRKMFHEDGRGCLQDLDRVADIDPAMSARLAVTRGQCEMLVGRCQAGKARVSAWYQRETAMSPARADEMAEQLASMRCRGGDATTRDQLLAAIFDLTQAAYVEAQSSAVCQERVERVERLLQTSGGRDDPDPQIAGAAKALFHTAAACFVEAGDCDAAEERFTRHFPPEGLEALKSPELRRQAVRDAFTASFAACVSP